MRDGADAEIVARFSDLTEHAAAGVLDQWAEDPRGRLALLILLDQFPRSVWRDSPRAFAQDPHALTLALEGLENGHFAALRMPWERLSYVIVLGHCEGPDHLARLERGHRIAQEVHNEVPDQPQAQLRVRGRAASPASPRHRGVRAIPSSQRAPGTGLHARGGGLHRGRTVPASTADLVVSPIGG